MRGVREQCEVKGEEAERERCLTLRAGAMKIFVGRMETLQELLRNSEGLEKISCPSTKNPRDASARDGEAYIVQRGTGAGYSHRIMVRRD